MRRMTWTPLSLSTKSLSSPTFKANAAFSKDGVILPRVNGPRSPPRLALRVVKKSQVVSADVLN
jgi:hypothetical protein